MRGPGSALVRDGEGESAGAVAVCHTECHEWDTGGEPVYELRGGLLYRTRWQPEASELMPEYRLAAPGATGPVRATLRRAQAN